MDNSVGKKRALGEHFLFANRAQIEEIRSWKFRGTSAYELFQTQKSSRALRSSLGAELRLTIRSGWPSPRSLRPVKDGREVGPKGVGSRSLAIHHRAETTPSRFREGEMAEGTLGAAECGLFRESVQEAALQGRSRLGGACWAGGFARGRYRTAAGLHRAFRCRLASSRDRGCPSQSGWGKSSAASGRRGGGREG